MPIYTYKCPDCGKIEDAYRSVDDRHKGPECHGQMLKTISAIMLQPILGGGNDPGYMCPVTDEFVSSRKRRREIMKEHNLVESG